jgi:hypothetical protein
MPAPSAQASAVTRAVRNSAAAACAVSRRISRLLRFFRAIGESVAARGQILARTGDGIACGERDREESERNSDDSSHERFSF